MSVLLCDSNGELWYTRAKELDYNYVSMPYTIDGKEYFYDLGENTDFDFFYKRVRAGSTPITSALNPENYKEIIEPFFAKGEDVLYVSFSHAMSGTFEQLKKALVELKAKYPKRTFTIFNTNSISVGAGIQQEQAAILKKQGATDKQILSFLEKFTNQVAIYFVVDDLMHLKRGGRLSAAAAFAGTLLSLKPLITIGENGALKVVEKISGRKKSLLALVNKAVNDLIEPEKYTVFVLDADCKEDGDFIKNAILEKRPEANVFRQPVGPVIGTHCGPGTVGVCFVANQRPIPLKK